MFYWLLIWLIEKSLLVSFWPLGSPSWCRALAGPTPSLYVPGTGTRVPICKIFMCESAYNHYGTKKSTERSLKTWRATAKKCSTIFRSTWTQKNHREDRQKSVPVQKEFTHVVLFFHYLFFLSFTAGKKRLFL